MVNLVDDKKVEEEEEEEEGDKEDGEDEEGEEDENLDFLQNFPNFYSMAADMMNQLDEQIPEVLLTRNSSVIEVEVSTEASQLNSTSTAKLPVEAFDPATLLRRLET